MAIPLSYNLRNLVARKTTTLMTALGIALTVAVLLSVAAMVEGLNTSLTSTGHPLNVLVMRKGGTAELNSVIAPASFQVASNNVSPSRALSPTSPILSLLTSPLETLMRRRPIACWISLSNWCGVRAAQP